MTNNDNTSINRLVAVIIALILGFLLGLFAAGYVHAETTGPGDHLLVAKAAGDQCVGTSGYTCTEIAAMQRLPETGGDLAVVDDWYMEDTTALEVILRIFCFGVGLWIFAELFLWMLRKWRHRR